MTDSKLGGPSVGATLLMLVGAALFMLGFFGLYQLLGAGMPAFGLIFLVYWAAILKQDPASYLPTLLGGLTGIFLGWVLVAVIPLIGSGSIVLSVTAVAVVLFCFMRGHIALLINNSTMLFITAATIAELNVTQNAIKMVFSLLIGACYMGLTALGMAMFLKLRAQKDG